MRRDRVVGRAQILGLMYAESGLRRSVLRAVILTIALTLATGACAGATSLGQCREEQNRGIEMMERTIEVTLEGTRFKATRGDSCGDTGQPLTVVWVSVKDWQESETGVAYFEGRGWNRRDKYWMLSPDGRYAVNIGTARGSDGSPAYVSMQVRHASQS